MLHSVEGTDIIEDNHWYPISLSLGKD